MLGRPPEMGSTGLFDGNVQLPEFGFSPVIGGFLIRLFTVLPFR